MSKNIVLLSDGTGNSSTALSKSNVWRLYQALDLGPATGDQTQQIAFYDDGVGTSGFRPLKLLGGVFGWGLSRNVRQIYEQLCRHYEPGDKIFIFGFSRGAFTARVLAHFVATCGILKFEDVVSGKAKRVKAPEPACLDMETEEGLKVGVKAAYKSYRSSYWRQATLRLRILAAPCRIIRNMVSGEVPPPEVFRDKYSHPLPANIGKPDDRLISFIGVWDTVDAVGMPVDELCEVLDEWVYPYKFPDQKLSEHVGRASQALAIDDERQTFRPLLWDEVVRDDKDKKTGDDGRLNQVWFCGMHSNVGGGYPDDDLSVISLNWMIKEVAEKDKGPAKEARDPALRFIAPVVKAYSQRGNALGKIYDSRSGAGVYYRYKPRRIWNLCNDGRVCVTTAKIHHTVFDRIRNQRVGYAPPGLPRDYCVVDADGSVGEQNISTSESDQGPEETNDFERRHALLERAQNHIWWRRIVYFCLLALTLLVVLSPHWSPRIPGLEPTNWLQTGLSLLFSVVGGYLPAFAAYWTDAWTQSAYAFVVFVVLFIGIKLWSGLPSRRQQMLAETAWFRFKHRGDGGHWPEPAAARTYERLARRYRRSSGTGWLSYVLRRYVVKLVFAAVCLYAVYAVGYRSVVHYPYARDGVCNLPKAVSTVPAVKKPSASGDANKTPELPQSAGNGELLADFKFEADKPCVDTGVDLEKGQLYSITIDPLNEGDKKFALPMPGPKAWVTAKFEHLTCQKQADGAGWMDSTVPATFKGLNCFWKRFDPRSFALAFPARRHVSIPWYTLTGKIGATRGNAFPMDLRRFKFRSTESGRFYVYVNDAINVPVSEILGFENKPNNGWEVFYNNNKGKANITITRVNTLPRQADGKGCAECD